MEQCKINTADKALQSAANLTEEKKASQMKSMLASMVHPVFFRC